MIPPPRTPRRPTDVARSRAAAELGLTAAATLAALLLMRVLFAATGVSERVIAGAVVYGASAPLVLPLELIPAGSRPFVGGATLADVTRGSWPADGYEAGPLDAAGLPAYTACQWAGGPLAP